MSTVTYTFFSDGGVLPEEFSDPAAPGGADVLPARLFLCHPDDPDDGVLSEMRRGLPPERRVPWIDGRARESAASALEGSAYAREMSDDERRGLARHVRSTPCYDGDAS